MEEPPDPRATEADEWLAEREDRQRERERQRAQEPAQTRQLCLPLRGLA
jgi:hypothetical protein